MVIESREKATLSQINLLDPAQAGFCGRGSNFTMGRGFLSKEQVLQRRLQGSLEAVAGHTLSNCLAACVG